MDPSTKAPSFAGAHRQSATLLKDQKSTGNLPTGAPVVALDAKSSPAGAKSRDATSDAGSTVSLTGRSARAIDTSSSEWTRLRANMERDPTCMAPKFDALYKRSMFTSDASVHHKVDELRQFLAGSGPTAAGEVSAQTRAGRTAVAAELMRLAGQYNAALSKGDKACSAVVQRYKLLDRVSRLAFDGVAKEAAAGKAELRDCVVVGMLSYAAVGFPPAMESMRFHLLDLQLSRKLSSAAEIGFVVGPALQRTTPTYRDNVRETDAGVLQSFLKKAAQS